MSETRELVTLRFRAVGTRIEATAEVPPHPIAVSNLLPLLQRVEEAVVETAVAAAVEEGRTVSCRAGCGACCRQLVPVSVAEADYLARRVSELPDDERRAVEARFTAALAGLDRLGLVERLRTLPGDPDVAAVHDYGVRYFAAGVACPFLVDESCSIHPHRPLSCREYLVVSPAERCARPEAEPIERVPVPRDLSAAMYRLGDGTPASPTHWIPLVLVLEWQATHGPLPLRPAKDLLRGLADQAGTAAATASPSDGEPSD